MIPLDRTTVIDLNRLSARSGAKRGLVARASVATMSGGRFRSTPKGRAHFAAWLRRSSVTGDKPRSTPHSSPCTKMRSVTAVRSKGIML